ncbi:hypothetical protein [Paenibacillus sp. YYML68]|uniref:hypothetical protein n=1 Tax=Paenibacillus sp. YYML68 TaxID=2909250 RepID=UPI0024922A8F|nr:hypothetical protein [Paenibacillus sp. YYML68]
MFEQIIKSGSVETTVLQHGLVFDCSKGMYPSRVSGYVGNSTMRIGSDVTTLYGYVYESGLIIKVGGQVWGPLQNGYYFSVVGECELSGNGKAVFFERVGFRGQQCIGGPTEERGRVSYIDGCSDSILIYPPRMGDPCLNLLWFPKNIRQSMHIHPTVRLGLVIKGEGRCITPEGELPLKEGNIFYLAEMGQHCFYTDDSQMAIVAYHPDSDWGPTDTNHPMLNRTFIR